MCQKSKDTFNVQNNGFTFLSFLWGPKDRKGKRNTTLACKEEEAKKEGGKKMRFEVDWKKGKGG